jgi:hypothetical protein
MEAQMKLTVPAILTAALIAASPAALAQNYQGTTSKPGASFQKDDSTAAPTRAKKRHMASHKKTHHAKHMKSNAQTTGAGSSSNPAAATTHEDKTPKSR